MPEVSVIIPTFNRASTLVEAVQSVLNQSFQDFELIIVDDGSTDETTTKLQPYLPFIKYHFQENRGVSSARNTGIQLASGAYIAFLDSDDLWLEKKLEEQMNFFRRWNQAAACYTDEIWIRNGVRVNPRIKHQKHSGWIFKYSLPLCIVSPSSICLHRSIITHLGPFDDTLPACEDYDFWLRLSLHYPVHFIPQPLIIKRGGHSDQLSRRIKILDRYRIMALEKILFLERLGPEQRREVLKELIRKCSVVRTGAYKRDKRIQGQYYQDKIERYQHELLLLKKTEKK